jgi:UDP-2,4-diacetamido-2,4,6-trideoxy-beta-L-altropyranose hydrolase
MPKQKIIFRVDGSSAIGLGHISRCCALADMLKDNFEIYFYTRANAQPVIKDIKQYSTEIVKLNNNISYNEEAAEWISVLEGNEIVVLDGYNFDTHYQQKIKEKGCKVVCIDDIYAYHFLADVVINHAPGINEKNYSTESYTKLYLGTDYVLLKKDFLEEALKKHTCFDFKESPVLICLGGADANNVTKEVLEKIMHLFSDKKINVVVGAAYIHLEELNKLIKKQQYVSLHINIEPEDMLKLMQQCSIAITSASTIALEYICAKGNLYLKQTADNQKDLYNSLIKKKCAYPYELLKDQNNSNEIISNQYKLIDGKSNKLLQKIFNDLSEIHSSGKLKFVRAKNKDVNLLFEWVNDPEVRAQSLSSNNITYEVHKNWFSKKLADKNCYLYIVYNSNVPAGMIRFDVYNNESTISYLVDKLQRGRGIGSLVINEGIKQFKNDSHFTGCLKATVKNTNTASLKIFENAGFEKENDNANLIHFKKLVA